MKRIILGFVCGVVISGLAMGQNVKTIGTSGSAGYLSIELRNNGSAVGDTATWNDGTNAQATTIWKSNFMFHDGTNTWWADGDSGDGHTNQATAGTPVNADAQNMTNTFTFTGNASLSASLAFALSQPTPSNVTRATYTWTFSNSGGSPISLRFCWLHDADNYIAGTSYNDDLVGFVNSANNSLGAIGIGNSNGAGGIDLDGGTLIDSTTTPDALLGIGGGNGPGNWWISAGGWADQNGATAGNGIVNDYKNDIVDDTDATVDANADDVLDAGGDAGAAMQWALTVPAGGNVVLVHTATWGLDTDLVPNGWTGTADVRDWNLY